MNRNRLLPFIFLMALAAVCLPSLASAQGDPTRYRGKNRLLLVFAPAKTDPRWQKQNALLAQSRSAFRDRDLLRFDYIGPDDKAIHERYGVEAGQFRVLLIGKDGHVASGGPTPLTLGDLTSQIDKMPMRQEEMKRKERNRKEMRRRGQ